MSWCYPHLLFPGPNYSIYSPLHKVVLDSGPLVTWYEKHDAIHKTWSMQGHRQHARKFGEVRSCGFWVIRADRETHEKNRQTDRHAPHDTSHSSWKRSIATYSILDQPELTEKTRCFAIVHDTRRFSYRRTIFLITRLSNSPVCHPLPMWWYRIAFRLSEISLWISIAFVPANRLPLTASLRPLFASHTAKGYISLSVLKQVLPQSNLGRVRRSRTTVQQSPRGLQRDAQNSLPSPKLALTLRRLPPM